MIGRAEIAALQDTLFRGLACGQLQPEWQAAEGYAELPLTPSHALQVWSLLLPPQPVECFGSRRALRHDRYSRILQGGVAELELLPRPHDAGLWLAWGGQPDDLPLIVELGQMRRKERDAATGCPSYVTLAGIWHERRVTDRNSVILVERRNLRPGPDLILTPVEVAPAPPAPELSAGLLANALRDALARLDDAAWRAMTAAVTPSPLQLEI